MKNRYLITKGENITHLWDTVGFYNTQKQAIDVYNDLPKTKAIQLVDLEINAVIRQYDDLNGEYFAWQADFSGYGGIFGGHTQKELVEKIKAHLIECEFSLNDIQQNNIEFTFNDNNYPSVIRALNKILPKKLKANEDFLTTFFKNS